MFRNPWFRRAIITLLAASTLAGVIGRGSIANLVSAQPAAVCGDANWKPQNLGNSSSAGEKKDGAPCQRDLVKNPVYVKVPPFCNDDMAVVSVDKGSMSVKSSYIFNGSGWTLVSSIANVDDGGTVLSGVDSSVQLVVQVQNNGGVASTDRQLKVSNNDYKYADHQTHSVTAAGQHLDSDERPTPCYNSTLSPSKG